MPAPYKKTKRFAKPFGFLYALSLESIIAVDVMKRARVTPANQTEERPNWLARLPDPWDEEVLSTAFDLFAQKGFDGATMSEIASRAGVSKRTVYERYADKADLFRALLAWGARGNLPDAPASDAGDARDALTQHAAAVLSAMMRPESIDLFRIVAAASPRFPEIGVMFDEMTRAASVKIVRGLSRRLAKEKAIATRDHTAFASDFIGLLRGDVYFRALVGAAQPLSQAAVAAEARRVVSVLLKAYA